MGAPSQAVGENHWSDVNEHADHLLPLVQNKSLVEGENGPRLEEQDLGARKVCRCLIDCSGWGFGVWHQGTVGGHETNLE